MLYLQVMIIKYGLIPEFIGRMPIIATLDDLDEKSLIKILQEPKNSLTKQFKRLFEFDNVKLTFKDEAILEIAKKAIKIASEICVFTNDNLSMEKI